ncbi:MAG: hypothetical protein IKK17_02830 [Oscillospiraceae bacterium]|nr:hypothetical protein [Oscillospiraceae bacterium]
MSNIPVWAMGCALRQASVPCAEEIAMMLCRRKKEVAPDVPDVPYAVETLKAVGGSYVDAVYFNGDGKNEASTPFLVGEFPLEQTFEWIYHWGWDTAEPTKEACLTLQITNLGWSPKVGDFIKLRYMLPKVTYCKFYPYDTAQGSAYKDPDYYTFEMNLYGSGEKTAVCTVTHSTQTGVANCYDNAAEEPQTYSELFANRTFTPITEGNNLLGFELTGRLMCTMDSVCIKITAHKASAYNNAKLQVQYASVDDLTVEAYEIPMSQASAPAAEYE